MDAVARLLREPGVRSGTVNCWMVEAEAAEGRLERARLVVSQADLVESPATVDIPQDKSRQGLTQVSSGTGVGSYML